MNAKQFIAIGLALVLAFCSFAISYTTLAELALQNNIEPSYLFPLIIDGVMILALLWRLVGDEPEYAQYTLGAYVLMSIGFNSIAHGNPLSAIMAAVAPVTMFAVSEIGASMLHQKDTKVKRDAKGRFVKKVTTDGE
jgi:tellurite resistance protein TehA-like permease